MARIKKKGLDYFPLNTDFIHDRAVRRLMKREGDAVLSILVEVLSYIYAGEGYYVCADRLFYEDLSAGLYENSSSDVERVVRLAVEYGLFDAGLFDRCCILTSPEIQRQYLFSTRRRTVSQLDAAYCLLSGEELAGHKPDGKKPDKKEPDGKKPDETKPDAVAELPACFPQTVSVESRSGGNNVTFVPENVTSGTHSTAQYSIAQHSVAQQIKEYPLLNPPLQKTGEEVEAGIEQEAISSVTSCGKDPAVSCGRKDRKEWTRESLDRLRPPSDGTPRNYSGLLDNLRLYDIPPSEQYAIIRKSNFGAIGGTVWKGIATLRGSGGKIKLPGRYLLSVVNKKQEPVAYPGAGS